MRRCADASRIDAYLRNELSPEEAARFEEHYFDCPECFRELGERSALAEALKEAGPAAFAARVPARKSWRWALAAAAALLSVAVGLKLFSPRPPKPSEITFSGDETVRGASLGIVGPSGALGAAPERLEWRAVSRAAEYSVALEEGASTIWKATTAASSADLPEDIRLKLRAGVAYTWRVRAYTSRGTLVAVSDPAVFTLIR
jgi:anti-sigma factor RsiW